MATFQKLLWCPWAGLTALSQERPSVYLFFMNDLRSAPDASGSESGKRLPRCGLRSASTRLRIAAENTSIIQRTSCCCMGPSPIPTGEVRALASYQHEHARAHARAQALAQLRTTEHPARCGSFETEPWKGSITFLVFLLKLNEPEPQRLRAPPSALMSPTSSRAGQCLLSVPLLVQVELLFLKHRSRTGHPKDTELEESHLDS